MGILNDTFGQAGTAVEFFGGTSQWYLVGLLLLTVFICFLIAYKVNAEGIISLTVLGLLSVGSYQLFIIDEQLIQTTLLILFIFVGFIAYIFISK